MIKSEVEWLKLFTLFKKNHFKIFTRNLPNIVNNLLSIIDESTIVSFLVKPKRKFWIYCQTYYFLVIYLLIVVFNRVGYKIDKREEGCSDLKNLIKTNFDPIFNLNFCFEKKAATREKILKELNIFF